MNLPDLTPKQKAFPYQVEAVEHVRDLEYSAVFHEQGLGKTKIAIDVALYWIAGNYLDCVIIVAKKSLVPNWIAEFEEHSHIKPAVVGSDSNENYYTLNSSCRIIVAHYEAIKKEESRIALLCEGIRVGIILDEAHKIKNPNTAVTRSFLNLRKSFKRRMILTGTPAANRPYDLWSQIFFLDGGSALGADYESFKLNTDIDFVPKGGSRDMYVEELGGISEKIAAFAVRENKDGGIIELPDKKFSRISAEWEPLQRDMYLQTRNELSLVVQKGAEITEDDSSPILKRMMRLVQLAAYPGLVDDNYRRAPGKIAPLVDLVGQISDRGEKVIVWTSFNGNVHLIKDHLSEFGCRLVYGKMSVEDRYKSISDFKSSPGVRVLIATPGAAKEGLTLTVANNAIYFDRSFSLDDYLQSQDRIHRISQRRTCNYYTIVMESSIDEWIDELLVAKMIAAKYSQGDIDDREFRESMRFSFRDSLQKVLGTDE